MTNLTNEQEFDLLAKFVTALGSSVVVTDIVWESSDEDVATVTQSASDPAKVLVSAVDEGETTITVSAKNSNGKVISGNYEVVVELTNAELVIFEASAPRPKTPPTP